LAEIARGTARLNLSRGKKPVDKGPALCYIKCTNTDNTVEQREEELTAMIFSLMLPTLALAFFAVVVAAAILRR
jgi:hypothetical protein